jgi:prolipoprotein diacylglyceryltransferase
MYLLFAIFSLIILIVSVVLFFISNKKDRGQKSYKPPTVDPKAPAVDPNAPAVTPLTPDEIKKNQNIWKYVWYGSIGGMAIFGVIFLVTGGMAIKNAMSKPSLPDPSSHGSASDYQ